jgi:hypothetical protein
MLEALAFARECLSSRWEEARVAYRLEVSDPRGKPVSRSAPAGDRKNWRFVWPAVDDVPIQGIVARD